MPSSSTDVAGYALSIGTSSGSYLSSMETTIPVSAATAGAGGSLAYNIQLDRSRAHYLAMRAYDGSANFSTYSNEIRVAALTSSATTTTTTTTSGTTLAAAASAVASPSSLASETGTVGSSGSETASAAEAELAAAAAAASVALDLDGSSEYLASALAAPLDAEAGLTFSLWAKAPAGDSGRRGLLRVASADGGSGVELSLVTGPAGKTLELRAFAAAQGLDDVRETPAPIADGEWWNLSLVIDSEQGTALLYLDGELIAARAAGGLSTALSAESYAFVLGTGEAGRSAPWLGRLGHAAVWNTALLPDEIAEISLLGHALDLRADSAEYLGAAALAHYWRLGADAEAVGLDYGVAPIDLDDPLGGLDAADVVDDAPESLAPALAAN